MPGTQTKTGLRDEARSAGATIFTLGGIGAAFGVASCCALPLLLASLGISSVWLTGIALFAAPHRQFLLFAGAISLAVGAILLWRRRQAVACGPKSIFSSPAVRGLTFAGLLIGLTLLTFGTIYA